MKTHADHKPEIKNRPVLGRPAGKHPGNIPGAPFADNRTAAIRQHKLQELADNSPKVRQLRTLQGLADNRANTKHPAPAANAGAKNKGPVAAQAGPPIQRVITGLEDYQEPDNVPGAWVDAYINDILSGQTHLTDEHILHLYTAVRGRPYSDEGVEFVHVGDNHWNVRINGQLYLATPDGSCAIHAVDLADRVLKGQVIDPLVFHSAPGETVELYRGQLFIYAGEDEGGGQIKRVIADGVRDSDNVYESGFGPILRELMLEESIKNDPVQLKSMFEIAYTQILKNKSIVGLPKPSVAKSVLDKQKFFDEDYDSLSQMLESALSTIYESSVSRDGIDLSGSLYQSLIKSNLKKALPNFKSAKEGRAEKEKLKKESEKSKKKKKSKDRPKRKLSGDKLLEKGKRKRLSEKLAKEEFQAKIMRASELSKSRLVKKHKNIEGMVKKGEVDLSDLPSLSSSQKFSAFEGFKAPSSVHKKDLQFGLKGGEKSSFGKGGFQVKGLGTYPQEMIWFQENLPKWRGTEQEIFQAMQEKDLERLTELTNKKDATRLLRFEDLGILERWRAGPFGVGVAAWSKLGFHGDISFSEYMKSMPMREPEATTNVSKTDSFDNPFNPKLWKEQQSSMVKGIEKLMEVEVPEGEMYDEHAQKFLDQLADEPEEGDPTEEMIDLSATFMMSPNPYINEDSEDDDR